MGERKSNKKLVRIAGIAAVILLGASVVFIAKKKAEPSIPSGFARANGRLEATQIELATKYAGRILDTFVKEGDRVQKDQVVAGMDVRDLDAQLAEAQANVAQAQSSKATALATVTQQQSALVVAQSQYAQRTVELGNVQKNFGRTKALLHSGSATQQQLDNDQASLDAARNSIDSSAANVNAAKAELEVAKSRVHQADAEISAAKATVDRISSNREDAALKAPTAGRIQHQLARQGEIVGAGGAVFEMIDTGDVYMTVFFPEKIAGKLSIGSEGRIVLDAAPASPIPATVSYVAEEAQFTPKAVENSDERDQLVFEVRFAVDPEALVTYAPLVKVGVPGVAFARVDQSAQWPQSLALHAPADGSAD